MLTRLSSRLLPLHAISSGLLVVRVGGILANRPPDWPTDLKKQILTSLTRHQLRTPGHQRMINAHLNS